EALGGALLAQKDYAGAEKVFREDLEKNPRSGRSLWGLLESLRGLKRNYEAQFVELQYQDAWQRADRPVRLRDLW
ncbi:MAG TPA: hypothetical protein VF669_08030, partial [Tepidisphaeraceae bacterium]